MTENKEFKHQSILLDECIEALHIKNDGIYVDLTTGGAGHSMAILKKLSKNANLICFDKDAYAQEVAKSRLLSLNETIGARIDFINDDFSSFSSSLAALGIKKVDGVLADLGVSSYQLDEAERGFSYMKDGPLDMRMDRRQSETAATYLARASQEEMAKCFSIYGEERYAKLIARAIAYHRQNKPITRTKELVDIIYEAIPAKARREKQHPSKRVFQALRIQINGELNSLSDLLKVLPNILMKMEELFFLVFIL